MSIIEARLIVSTPQAEETMIYIARVSSPNQDNPEYVKLLRYCIRQGHWSVFEHAHATVEIRAPRWLTMQMLRHRSFSFSEFSQRYAEVPDSFYISEGRMQDSKNRQSSLECGDKKLADWWHGLQVDIWDVCYADYCDAIKRGIAKEVARNILPVGAMSRIYMTGNVRSWIHYLQVRMDPSTQKEHREVAEKIHEVLLEVFPTTLEAAFPTRGTADAT